MKGFIFDIQHYAIYDGPGIRTLVFFKGCPLRCAWCQNPESWRTRPQVSFFGEKCDGCGACREACPAGAIGMEKGRARRDFERCTDCGSCAQACHNNAAEIIGREIASAEIMEKVCMDRPFYENSGGGVTFSGGEPTLQADFLMETLKALKKEGIHTALETCGQFRQDLLDPLLETVDLFLYDIKHAEPARHRELTGVSPERIQSGFSEILSKAGRGRIIPRVPIVPGANEDAASMDGIITLLKKADYAGPVHLMPYNSMAKTKWEKIGLGREYREFPSLGDDGLEAISQRFEAAGFEAVCNR